MQKKELIDVLLREHVDKLPKWYCDLNCFRLPEGFPIALVECGGNDQETMKNPAHKLAFEAVAEALGDEGTSRAWWLVELGRTEDAWRTWYAARECRLPHNSPKLTDAPHNEHGEANAD